MLCGVDEAGKGAVLGPLVVAAVGCRTADDLLGIPVRDSKLLRPEQREQLFEVITDRFITAVTQISAGTIDSMRRNMTMNMLIARAHAKVIDEIRPTTAYVDACDVIAARYGHMVSSCLQCSCQIISAHHADVDHPVVSAASIVAKVIRDRALASLRDEFGDLGSGYPSDPKTVAFLAGYIRESGRPPSCARASWETTRELVSQREQVDLSRFF